MSNTQISTSRTPLARQLTVNGHDLSYVQAVVPNVTKSAMAIYASEFDDDVFFYCKIVGITADGPIFAFFEVSRDTMSALLASKTDILSFEKAAASVSFVVVNGPAVPETDSEKTMFAITQDPIGIQENTNEVVFQDIADVVRVLGEVDISLYAHADAGTYAELVESTKHITVKD